ncbi:MAG: LTA synthase family protein [Eubacteriales bacterium]|nr:LTA synthase family protein [Eubacteriales bacterium]
MHKLKSRFSLPEILKVLLLSIVLVLLTWAVYSYQTSHPLSHNAHRLGKKWKSKTQTPLLTAEDELTIRIKAADPFLKRLTLMLIPEGDLTDLQLVLEISDLQEHSLYRSEMDLELKQAGEKSRFDTDLALTAGEFYNYRFTIEHKKNAAAVQTAGVHFLLRDPDASMQTARFNGEELAGALLLSDRYTYIDHSELWYLIAAHLLLLLVFFFGKPLGERLQRHRSAGRLISILLLAVLPALAYYLTQRICSWAWQPELPKAAWSLLFYYLLDLFLIGLFRKVKKGQLLFLLFLLIAALADYFVDSFRGKPLLITDLTAIGTAATVAGSYRFTIALNTALMIDGCILLLLFCDAFLPAEFPKTKRGYGSRIGLAAAAVLALAVFDQTKLTDGWINSGSFWNMNLTYSQQGYLTTLLSQIHYLKLEKPEGYSVELTQTAASAASAAYEEAHKKTEAADTVTPTNLIVIMNESFWDPDTMGDLPSDEEILPFWRSLLSEPGVTSGKLYVPVYGGGTCNTEYEVLTGNTTQFLPNGVIAFESFCGSDEYGLASSLNKLGYASAAIHPNSPTAWNRERVYDWMKFERFLSLDNWIGEHAKIRSFVSDLSVYKEIETLTEEKAAGAPQFTFAVTIQNHGGYSAETAADYEPSVTLQTQTEYPMAELYLSLIRESDEALKQLIEYYQNIKEPIMIVFFGDHQPALEPAFYQELQATRTDEPTAPAQEASYITSYLIWTNYEREGTQLDMSANYLGAYVMEQAGLSLTEYQKYLLQLQKDYPVLGVTAYLDNAGTWHSYEENSDALTAYRYLQYSNVVDRDNRDTNIFTLN